MLRVSVEPLTAQPASAEPMVAKAEGPSPSPTPEAQRPLPEANPRTATTGQRPTETVRVDTDRLDQLMDLAGQLVINRAQFSQIGGRLKAVVDCNQAVRALEKLSGNWTSWAPAVHSASTTNTSPRNWSPSAVRSGGSATTWSPFAVRSRL